MKKIIFVCLIICINLLGHSSKSFLKVDPVQTLVFIDPINLLCKSKFFFELLPFYIQNTSKSEIGNYFLPFNKSSLLTTENNSPNQYKRDVNALNLNIDYEDERFESITKFCPEYKNTGILFHINSFLKKNLWIDVILPFSYLKTDMNPQETIINPGQNLIAGSVENVTQALDQKSWKYGKVNGPKCARGLNDIDFKIGNVFEAKNFSAYPFIGAIIPTGNKPKAEFVFEPIIGNNKHFSIQTGIINFYKPCLNRKSSLVFYLDFIFFYSFKNKQKRIFDLIEKEWGRYMLVYSSPKKALIAFNNAGDPENGDRGEPGINYFTQEAYVSPGFSFQSTLRAWFQKPCLRNELGLSLFFRDKEKICLNSSGLSPVALVGAAGAGTTTNARTINYNYIGTKINDMEDAKIDDGEYATLSISDLNIDSASAAAALSITFFYKVQYHLRKKYKLNLGTSYKFCRFNDSINLISIWGGLTYEF